MGLACLQSVIFHIEKHPHYTWFEQCVAFFPSRTWEIAYNLVCILIMCGLPLVCIIYAHAAILWKINKKLHDDEVLNHASSSGGGALHDGRRSGQIERARIKTLKVTLVMLFVFVVCWSPYFVMSVWWWIDQESAKSIDAKIQRGLLLSAVSSSCVNPIAYGMCNRTLCEELSRCCMSRRRRNLMEMGFLVANNIDNNR
ncbi:Gonadotropin-releasing hormone receptor [Lamellibrachia satsuma]|nr:Gonadotropin-releasing hormone receptor [Lamellibrachia satsuma]